MIESPHEPDYSNDRDVGGYRPRITPTDTDVGGYLASHYSNDKDVGGYLA